MGWENRSGRLYYYRKDRSGRRVRSLYVGRGEIAELTALLNTMHQQDQRVRLTKERQERNALRPLERNIDALAQLASTLVDATLIAGGFHQHKRQWRKRKA